MNRDIAQYVLQLRDRVTRRQHHVLLVLACHHQQARETFWPTRTKIATELQMDESQLRRIIGELEQAGILKHIPGIGAGNRSSFIFVEFEKGDIKGDKKGDFFDPAIRNYKTFTKPLQDQKGGQVQVESKSPPSSPKFTQADFDQRDLRHLGAAFRKFDQIKEASVGGGERWTDEKFYGWISLESGLTPTRIRELEKLAYGRKEPQRATG
jgi:hypothetical protein